MINVFINGINGKMGQEVAKLANECSTMNLIGGYDRTLRSDSSCPIFTSYKNITVKPDVIIDFSSPEASIAMLSYALENKLPVVIATTGFNDMQKKQIKEASKHIPIFHSSNLSYEIALMGKLVASISQELPDAEIEIIETHHDKKLDSPSGTALLLADSINKSNNWNYSYELNRMQKREKRDPKEIGFSSVRGGNVVGKHSVLFFSKNEILEIKHTALSRTVFAEGAIKAAKFIVNKENGIYTF